MLHDIASKTDNGNSIALVALLTGKIYKSKYVKIYNASELKINVTGETIVHADGEPFKINKTIEIKIIPKSLKIIVP